MLFVNFVDIVTILATKYNLSEDEARRLLLYDDENSYTKALNDIIKNINSELVSGSDVLQ